MPTTVKFRRGTTAQNDAFTGAAGELSVDTTLDQLRVHDGSTAGGFKVARQTDVDDLDTLISSSETTVASDANTSIDSVSTSTADGVTWEIVATDGSSTFNKTTVVAVNDGSSGVDYTEYGTMFSSTDLASYSVTVSGGNYVLYADPTTSGVTFKLTRTIVLA